jgi:hypothetical protein
MTMKVRKAYIGITILAYSILLMMAGNAYAIPYSFTVDRFEIDGNAPGHFVDEFNSGALSAAWSIGNPTVMESGGAVTLSSPGAMGTFQIGGLHAAIEQTQIINSGIADGLSAQDGAGDFTETSTWLPNLPAMTQQFHMEVFHSIGPGLTESVSISVANIDPTVATALGLSTPPPGDLLIGFGREAFDVGNFNFQAFAFNPATVTGNILLQLTFDDANNQFSGAFSLDGGGTFQSPFAPISFSAGDSAYHWGLYAMSLRTVPEPSTLLLLGSGLVGIAGLGRKKLV